MNRTEKMLLGLSSLDNIVNSLLGIWYVKYFLLLVDEKTLQLTYIISPVLGLVIGLVIATKVTRPTPKMIIPLWIISYSALISMQFGADYFTIVGSIVSPMFLTIMTPFRARINELNITSRAKYDTWMQVLRTFCTIIGVGMYSLVGDIMSLNLTVTWITIYILFDLDIIIIFSLIKYKKLKY